jgi:hypothetical protein
MRATAELVGLALMVTLAGCAGRADTSPQLSPTGPAASSPSADPFAALRRPWAHPPIPSGAACPVTTEVQSPDPELGPLLGTGPARAAGLGAGAVLEYVSPTAGATWRDRSWGGQKVLWAVDPAELGPVLIRGRRLDGPGEVAFEDPAQPELHLNTSSYEGQGGGWRDNPSYTRLKAPGCYVYQVDTSAGTWSVVFTAQGPVV